jgi:F-type H+-transporting ATPase subunit a
MINGAGAIGGVSVLWLLFEIFMYALETLVAFLQAYVFTILTAVYINLATSSH